MHFISEGKEQEPTLSYLSSATAGVVLQAFPLFIPAATSGTEISSNEEQIAETGSNQCWETGAGW